MAEEHFWFIDDHGEIQGPFGRENMEMWRPWFEPKSTLVFCGGSPPTNEERVHFRPYYEIFPSTHSTVESSIPANGSKDNCTAGFNSAQQEWGGRTSVDAVRAQLEKDDVGEITGFNGEENTAKVLKAQPIEENVDRVIDRANSQQRRRRKLRAHLKLVDILTRAQKQNAQSSRLENDLRTLETDARALKLARRKNLELDEKFRNIGVEYRKLPNLSNEGLGVRGGASSKPKQTARPVTIFELPENFAAAELRGLAAATGTGREKKAVAEKDDRTASYLARRSR